MSETLEQHEQLCRCSPTWGVSLCDHCMDDCKLGRPSRGAAKDRGGVGKHAVSGSGLHEGLNPSTAPNAAKRLCFFCTRDPDAGIGARNATRHTNPGEESMICQCGERTCAQALRRGIEGELIERGR